MYFHSQKNIYYGPSSVCEGDHVFLFHWDCVISLVLYSRSLCLFIHLLTQVFFRAVGYSNIQGIYMLQWRNVGNFFSLSSFFFWFFPLPFLFTLHMWTFLYSITGRFMNFMCLLYSGNDHGCNCLLKILISLLGMWTQK